MPNMLDFYRNRFMLVDYLRKKGKLIHVDLTNEEIDRQMIRASGECICEECGEPYRKHPYIDNVMDESGDRLQPFIHRVCDGLLVKL